MSNVIAASFSELSLVKLKNKEWLAKQRIAGKCVSRCLKRCKELIENITPSLSPLLLEKECLEIMRQMNCSPTFFNYKGFPGAICVSINCQLVHGIPSEYMIQPGDVVKVDLGATYEGAIADAAISAIYGAPKCSEHVLLLQTCKAALDNGIKAVSLNKRVGAIGYAINHVVKKTRYGLITNYGGHGIDENKPHAEPFVANKSQPTSGPRFQIGMTLAIEPMVVLGDTRTWISNDGWTVNASGISAHYEHTVFLSEDGVQVLTELD